MLNDARDRDVNSHLWSAGLSEAGSGVAVVSKAFYAADFGRSSLWRHGDRARIEGAAASSEIETWSLNRVRPSGFTSLVETTRKLRRSFCGPAVRRGQAITQDRRAKVSPFYSSNSLTSSATVSLAPVRAWTSSGLQPGATSFRTSPSEVRSMTARSVTTR